MWTRGKMWKQISLSISHRYLYYNHSLYSLRFFSCLRWIIVTISYLEFASLQERSKYLRGYHDCTKEDMITLGGLLFRVKVESDMSQFVMIPKMLKDLVPADQQKIMSPDEWKKVKNKLYRSTPKWSISCLRRWDWSSGVRLFYASLFFLQHIISSYKQQSGITVDEAKIDFLKIISSWPTFGCTFFEVKVS